jgi:hypothetical protein
MSLALKYYAQLDEKQRGVVRRVSAWTARLARASNDADPTSAPAPHTASVELDREEAVADDLPADLLAPYS